MATAATPPRKPAGAHRKAITRMLRTTGLLHVAEEAPLVELLKELADELDDDGGGARTRLAYLSAFKDLRRVLGVQPARRPRGSAEVPSTADSSAKPSTRKRASGESADVDVTEQLDTETGAVLNSLSDFKQRKGITA